MTSLEQSEPGQLTSPPEDEGDQNRSGGASKPADLGISENFTFSESDLDEVKKVAERLKLNPRRPSIARWMEENGPSGEPSALKRRTSAIDRQDKDVMLVTEDGLSGCQKFSNMSEALDWVKNELLELRMLDRQLARQLIDLRTEMHRLKLQKSCKEHQALLEDVTLELEEQDELADLPQCDLPFRFRYPLLSSAFADSASSLRGIGITRMNLSSRRFSLS